MADGAAELRFEARDGRTALGALYQRDPLRVLFPRAEADEPLTGALLTTSGGLVGGDRLAVRADVGAGAAGRVVAQAAEKIYRCPGAGIEIGVELRAGAGAWLEWLPQETILFDAARLRRRTVLQLVPGARALAGELVAFGRAAMGERLRRGRLHDAWELHRGGRLAWAETLRLDRDLPALLAAPAGFAGARAAGTVLYAADDAAEHLGYARELAAELSAPPELRCAASCVGPALVARWLGRDGWALRRAYGRYWTALRARVAGYPPIMPRLWQI